MSSEMVTARSHQTLGDEANAARRGHKGIGEAWTRAATEAATAGYGQTGMLTALAKTKTCLVLLSLIGISHLDAVLSLTSW